MTENAGKALTKQGDHPPMVGGSLFLDVRRFEHAQRVAQMLVTSTMIPVHFQNNLGNCLIALNLAERFMADPFMVMQNVYIVHGKPGLEAKLVIALVNQCGKFSPLQYKFDRDDNGKATACTCYATHKETSEVLEQTVTWKMVQAEGWHSKKGSKWLTMPELMFQYRSAAFFARVYCPEVILGMQTVDEIFDFTDMHRGASGEYSSEPSTTSDLSEAIKKKQAFTPKAAQTSRGEAGQEEEKPPAAEMPCPYCQKDIGADIRYRVSNNMEVFTCPFCQKEGRIENGLPVGSYKPDKTAQNSDDFKDDSADFRKEWINLKTAYDAYVIENESRIKAQLSKVKEEMREKWYRLIKSNTIPDKPWPLDVVPDTDEETKRKNLLSQTEDDLLDAIGKFDPEIVNKATSDCGYSELGRSCTLAEFENLLAKCKELKEIADQSSPIDNNRTSLIDAIEGSYNTEEIQSALVAYERASLAGCSTVELAMVHDYLIEHGGKED